MIFATSYNENIPIDKIFSKKEQRKKDKTIKFHNDL